MFSLSLELQSARVKNPCLSAKVQVTAKRIIGPTEDKNYDETATFDKNDKSRETYLRFARFLLMGILLCNIHFKYFETNDMLRPKWMFFDRRSVMTPEKYNTHIVGRSCKLLKRRI